jgi:hypothetical protein
MSYTLNVGLNNPFTKGTNTVDQTLKAILGCVSDITAVRVSYDQDEVAVIVDYAFHTGSLLVLATALDQDCVAVYDHSIGKGTLVGDKAEAWGPFNIEYFQFAKETV